jgi:hypothetical protein
MRRFRLSTLLLLVVTAALSLALVIQERRAARREAEIQFRRVITEYMRVSRVVYQTQPMEIQLDKASLQALADQRTAAKGADRCMGSALVKISEVSTSATVVEQPTFAVLVERAGAIGRFAW